MALTAEQIERRGDRLTASRVGVLMAGDPEKLLAPWVKYHRATPLTDASAELLEAVHGLLARYLRLVESGDCGNWFADDEAEVIAARAAIAKAEGK